MAPTTKEGQRSARRVAVAADRWVLGAESILCGRGSAAYLEPFSAFRTLPFTGVRSCTR